MGAMIGRNLKHIGNLDVDIMLFPFSYEAGVNFPKAIMMWLRGESVDASTLQPEYGRMFAKNDYLMEVN